MTKPMKENDELFVREVKSAYDEELQVKEKEDIENLQRLLRQLFQLQTDDQLNYGILQIMNEKRAAVEKFISKPSGPGQGWQDGSDPGDCPSASFI